MANGAKFFKANSLPALGSREPNSIYFVGSDSEDVREVYVTDKLNNAILYSREIPSSTILSIMTDGETVPAAFDVPTYEGTDEINRGFIIWDNTSGEFEFPGAYNDEIFEVSVCTLYKPGTITNRVTGYIELQKDSGSGFVTIASNAAYASRGSGNIDGSVSFKYLIKSQEGDNYRVRIKCLEQTTSDNILINSEGSFLSINLLK